MSIRGKLYFMARKIIFLNLAWSLAHDVLFNILGIVFYLLLARKSGDSGLGTYVYIVSFITFINASLDLGTSAHFWRKWSTDTNQLKSDLRQLVGIKTLLIFPPALFLALFVLWKEQSLSLYFFLMFMVGILDNYRGIGLSFLRSINSFDKVFLISASERIISIGGGAVALFLGLPLLTVFFFLLAGQLFSLFLSLLIVPLPFPSFRRLNAYHLIQSGFPIFTIGFLTTSYQKIDTILIRVILGLEKVGQYNAAYRILDTLLIIPSIIILTFLPTISTFLAGQEHSRLQGALSLTMKYLAILGIFIGVFFHYYASEILHFLYGSTFIEGTQVLRILGWSVLFFFLSAPLYAAVIANKQDRQMMKRLIFLNVLNVLGNIFLLPILGIPAAAILTLATEILGLCLLLHIFRLPFSVFHWGTKIFTLSLVIWLILFFIHPPLFPTLLITGSLYLFMLYVLKVIKVSDFL